MLVSCSQCKGDPNRRKHPGSPAPLGNERVGWRGGAFLSAVARNNVSRLNFSPAGSDPDGNLPALAWFLPKSPWPRWTSILHLRRNGCVSPQPGGPGKAAQGVEDG